MSLILMNEYQLVNKSISQSITTSYCALKVTKELANLVYRT